LGLVDAQVHQQVLAFQQQQVKKVIDDDASQNR